MAEVTGPDFTPEELAKNCSRPLGQRAAFLSRALFMDTGGRVQASSDLAHMYVAGRVTEREVMMAVDLLASGLSAEEAIKVVRKMRELTEG